MDNFYNKYGCFTIQQVPQRGEWDYYVSDQFSIEYSKLTANRLKIFSVEKDIWDKYYKVVNEFNIQLAKSINSNKTWQAQYKVERAELETLAEVINTQIKKHNSFYGVIISD